MVLKVYSNDNNNNNKHTHTHTYKEPVKLHYKGIENIPMKSQYLQAKLEAKTFHRITDMKASQNTSRLEPFEQTNSRLEPFEQTDSLGHN